MHNKPCLIWQITITIKPFAHPIYLINHDTPCDKDKPLNFFKRKLSELKNRLNAVFLTGINEPDSRFPYCLGKESQKILLLPSFNSLCPSSCWVKGNTFWQSRLCRRHFSPWMQGAEKTVPKKSLEERQAICQRASPLRISLILGLTSRVPQEHMENESLSTQSSI